MLSLAVTGECNHKNANAGNRKEQRARRIRRKEPRMDADKRGYLYVRGTKFLASTSFSA
jgi:hypothetical protein